MSVKAQVEQKQAELQDVEHQTLMDLVKTHADSTSALQNLQAAAALLKAATDSLAVSQHKYEKGAADILEMLNTQSALADAQMEHIRCQAEWNSARLSLLASAGKLGRAAVNSLVSKTSPFAVMRSPLPRKCHRKQQAQCQQGHPVQDNTLNHYLNIISSIFFIT